MCRFPVSHSDGRWIDLPVSVLSLIFVVLLATCVCGQDTDLPVTAARLDGSGPDWVTLTLDDFENVNCKSDTWSTRSDVIHCKGNCVGVIRSKKPYRNHELVLQWRHLKPAGNSGVFIWSPEASLTALKPETNGLPHGIEVQVLDLEYKDQYEKQSGKQADWFTCHGDVFPVGSSSMKPFAPVAPNGRRSFPSANHSRGVGQWNHYYVRAINGEVRLWVNGHEVSGGTDCQPDFGYLALESEGSPVDFRDIRIREVK